MPTHVLIAGGGIAALELVLALRELAGDRVDITVVAPEPEFVLRPMLVAELLGAGTAARVPLRRLADEIGFELVSDAIIEVDGERRRVLLRGGGALPYETLVLAPGARTLPAFDEAIHLPDAPALAALGDDIASGAVRHAAFVAPTRVGWLLPLYEAALLTANRHPGVRVSLVTPEESPLEAFGEHASRTVAEALALAGIGFIGGRPAPASPIAADRVVALPLVRGRRIPGVPVTGLYDFIPVDGHGQVTGLAEAYAIGDATDYPVKQGGIACQQAEAAAAHIAARRGAPVTPVPFRPKLRATLITGRGAPLALGGGQGPEKLPGRRLARHLRMQEFQRAR